MHKFPCWLFPFVFCKAGGKHNVVRKHTNQDSWDECTKCGKQYTW